MISYLKATMEKVNAPKAELIPMLLKNMGKEYPERSHKVVHASDITKEGFCPRQYALMDLAGVDRPPSYISPALRATFDVGNATADLVREEWLGEGAVGNWKCTTCGIEVSMSTKPTGGCTGKKCNWKYREVQFFDPVNEVSGSVDVFVNLKGSKLLTTEIKIMKAEDFAKLQAPLAEHRIRTSLYMWLIAASNSPVAPHIHPTLAKVLYVSRGFGKKSEDHGHIIPFKEFDVVRDDASVEPYLKKARQLAVFRQNGGPVPQREVCSTPDCPNAKSCPVRAHCFKD